MDGFVQSAGIGGGGAGAEAGARGCEGPEGLGPNSPLRQYSPEHVSRLYRRPTVNKPQEGGGE